jgi:hypothetical protein
MRNGRARTKAGRRSAGMRSATKLRPSMTPKQHIQTTLPTRVNIIKESLRRIIMWNGIQSRRLRIVEAALKGILTAAKATCSQRGRLWRCQKSSARSERISRMILRIPFHGAAPTVSECMRAYTVDRCQWCWLHSFMKADLRTSFKDYTEPNNGGAHSRRFARFAGGRRKLAACWLVTRPRKLLFCSHGSKGIVGFLAPRF